MAPVDTFLITWYIIFAFTAMSFEPLYYFGCEWSITCPAGASSRPLAAIGRVWSIYVTWDPLFHSPPLWLRVLCYIEVFVFGPLYGLTAYGLLWRKTWLPPLAYCFSGALIYSTIVYFLMEVLENAPGTNFLAVFLVNIPWTVIPIILVSRLRSISQSSHNEKYE